ncbi:MAG: S8 family serine peptidase [Deltaproteobacteria bacterium]|nr:S8 family serine peptidase [Deltaproteobacteria bacterium]
MAREKDRSLCPRSLSRFPNLIVVTGLLALASQALAGNTETSRLQPRQASPPAAVYALASDAPVERLVIKFHEGTRVRLRDGVLQEHHRSAVEQRQLQVLGLTPSRVADDATSAMNHLALSPQAGDLERMFTQPENQLEDWKTSGESKSGRELADLNLYFGAALEPNTRFGELEELLLELNSLASVEVAYLEPPAELAAIYSSEKPGPRSSTPNFQNQQGYLNAAPLGIDAHYAWTIDGGNGQNVQIVDVEWAWQTTHEDLPSLFHQGGTQNPTVGFRNHGTAVLGEMVGVNNSLGIKGIAYGAQAGYESIDQQSVASGISSAAIAAGSGDLILIEVQRQGPLNATSCTCNTLQCDFIAVEFLQADYDAIAAATANGVIVVEAAGNGSSNLDDPAYGGLFDRNVRDSGAIVVGASTSTGRVPTCWTNHGSRVDVHGWGENVATTGYGDLQGGAENQWYTSAFSGTSSASPIVTAAAACLQGASKSDGQGNMTSIEMRQLLVSTGTAQTGILAKPIGPLPNLRAALDQLIQNSPPTANFTFSGSGLNRSFNASTSTDDNGITDYQWTFPGGLAKAGVSVDHFFPNYGSHWVTLTVTDSHGETDSTSKLVNLPQPTITPKQALWYNPDRSGNGIDFFRNSAGIYTLVWYTYTSNGTPTWYISGSGSKFRSTWSQPLFKSTWNGSSNTLTNVGSVRLSFSSTSEAWFSWVLNGQTGGERFVHSHGGTGRSGMWYDPNESGWGTMIADGGSALVANIAFYQGSQPRWVQGQAISSSNAFMAVRWIDGVGLCPSCGGGSSTPPTGQVVGSTRIQIANGSSTSGSQTVNIQIPGGGTWNRSNIPISLLTEP